MCNVRAACLRLSVPACVLAIACGGPDPSISSVPAAWSLSGPRVSIGVAEGAEEDQLVAVVAAWLNASGQIVVLDYGKSVIEVFDTAGRHVRTIGRRGAGPGELALAAAAWPYRGDSVAVYDISARRLSIFDPAGDFARSFDSPLRWVPRPGIIPSQSCCVILGSFENGSFIGYLPDDVPIEPGPPRYSMRTVVRLSPEGSVADTLGHFESMLYAYDPDAASGVRSHEGSYSFRYVQVGDTLFGGNGSSGELIAVDPHGGTRAVALPGDAVPLDEAMRQKREEAIRADFAARGSSAYEGDLESNLPRLWAPDVPRFVSLLADAAGRLWLERWNPAYGLPGAPSEYDIVRTSGGHVATITLPPGARPLWADDARALLLERDSLDVEYLRLYDLTADPAEGR